MDPAIVSRTDGDRTLERLGGACAVAGTLILVVSLALHGDLPTHVSVSVALQFIADHDHRLFGHLGMWSSR